MRTTLFLATLLVAVTAFAGAAEAEIPPCEAPYLEADWCPPPYFGISELTVCGWLSPIDWYCMY